MQVVTACAVSPEKLRHLSKTSSAVFCPSRPSAGNTFSGTKELEFFDAQNTKWSGNSLPSSGVCVDNITSDKGNSVDKSTFTGSSGLPGSC